MPSESSRLSYLPNPINMDRIKGLFRGRHGNKDGRDTDPAEYEPLRTSGDDVAEEAQQEGQEGGYATAAVPFSWFEYTIFALVGVAMLWAW